MLFYVLLDAICCDCVNFSTYVHKICFSFMSTAFFLFNTFAWFQYQRNTGTIEWVEKYCHLFKFLEEFYTISTVSKGLAENTGEAIWAWSFFCGVVYHYSPKSPSPVEMYPINDYFILNTLWMIPSFLHIWVMCSLCAQLWYSVFTSIVVK